MANYEWIARFPTGRVQHLHCYTSDHRPILLSLDSNGERQRWRRKPFLFESMWVSEPSCKTTVAEAWAGPRSGTPMFNVTTKLKECKKRLKKWSKETFGSIKEQIRVTKGKLWEAEVQ